MSSYRQRVGARIRRERERHGWSQNELAHRTGIAQLTAQQISRWETGRAMPDDRYFAALEQTLGAQLIPNGDGD